jgi:tetraacyldisaccharide 4'-kinase
MASAPAPAAVVRMRGRWLEELPASPWRWLLTPAWLAFREVVIARGLLYDHGYRKPRELPVPVFSVGNLSAGGTGKTPAVRLVCDLLRELGRAPAVLSRGYRAQHGANNANEEAQLVGAATVVSDADRLRGGRHAISALGADCLVLDDGFQHRRLVRDCDLVLIDATDPWGGGRLLPLGRLREPRAALARADVLWVTRSDLVNPVALGSLLCELSAYGKPVLCSTQGPVCLSTLEGREVPASAAAGQRVLLSSGLGNPLGFERTASNAGLGVVAALRWRDHHHYLPADVLEISRRAAGVGARVVVPEKDAVKLRALVGATEQSGWWVLQAEPQLSPPSREILRQLLTEVLACRRVRDGAVAGAKTGRSADSG